MADFEFYNGSHTGQDIDRLLDLVPELSNSIQTIIADMPNDTDISHWEASYSWVNANGSNVLSHIQQSGNATIHHTHTNKSVIDGITAADIARWNAGGGGGGEGGMDFDWLPSRFDITSQTKDGITYEMYAANDAMLVSMTIPSATRSLAGLMSAEDKVALQSKLVREDLPASSMTSYAADSVTVYLYDGTEDEETVCDFNIVAATDKKAGLMSAADKAKLDNIKASSRPQIDGNIVVGKCVGFGSHDDIWYFCDKGTGVLIKGIDNPNEYNFILNNEIVEAKFHTYNSDEDYHIWRIDSPEGHKMCVFRLTEYNEKSKYLAFESVPLCDTAEYRTRCEGVYIVKGKIVNRRMVTYEITESNQDPHDYKFNYIVDIKQYVRLKVNRGTKHETTMWKFVRTHKQKKFKLTYIVRAIAKHRWKSIHKIILSKYKMREQ